MLKIVFRADASLQIGSGHIMRCLTLAHGLSEIGAKVTFLCKPHEGHLIDKIRKSGFSCLVLSAPVLNISKKSDDLAHSSWLGGTHWLIVDHYALDSCWEKQLVSLCKKLMVIDDLADRAHDCDLLLDQNLVAEQFTRYDGLLSEKCTRLLGPEYALLQDEYAKLYHRVPPRIGPVKNILIYFGGAVNHNLTFLAIRAFLDLRRDDLSLDVVINPEGLHTRAVKEVVESCTNITLHASLPTLAPLILKADIAIGAGGASSWERACLGLPSIIVTIAENQRAIASELDQRGVIRWLGHFDQVSGQDIYQAIEISVKNEGDLGEWSQVCRRHVDGKGVNRVVAMMKLDATTPLQVRLVGLEDESLLLRWANDRLLQQNAFQKVYIEEYMYRDWFYSRLRDVVKCKIYIVETEDGLPIGQVCFDLTDNGWEIDFYVDRAARGKKLGIKVLEIALLKHRHTEQGELVFGQVKLENNASQSVFEKLGFVRSKGEGGCTLSIAICSDVDSWINVFIPGLILQWLVEGYQCYWSHNVNELQSADLCFYLSYSRIVQREIRSKFRNNLVVHESDLPNGKGWSPLSWQVLDGKNRIPITLIEAVESVDSGQIYLQDWIDFEGYELIDQLRSAQAELTFKLCRQFVNKYPDIAVLGQEQEGNESFFSRRTPKNSELNVNKTILEQFDLLRIVDNSRYPAFFYMRGKKYVISIDHGEGW